MSYVAVFQEKHSGRLLQVIELVIPLQSTCLPVEGVLCLGLSAYQLLIDGFLLTADRGSVLC